MQGRACPVLMHGRNFRAERLRFPPASQLLTKVLGFVASVQGDEARLETTSPASPGLIVLYASVILTNHNHRHRDTIRACLQHCPGRVRTLRIEDMPMAFASVQKVRFFSYLLRHHCRYRYRHHRDHRIQSTGTLRHSQQTKRTVGARGRNSMGWKASKTLFAE